MQKVYLLTNFSTFLKSFSPIIVVGEQLKMLTRAPNYEPVLIATETWDPPEDSIFAQVQTERMYPAGQHDPDSPVEDIEEMVDLVYQQLKDILPETGVVIAHDLIFLPDYTIYNLAARRLAPERPGLQWLHWVHSATNPEDIARERGMFGKKYEEALNSPFPNALICYPNAYDIPRVARNFHFEEDQIVEVPHSTDPTEGLHPLVQRLYDQLHLGDVKVLTVFPLRLDRGKYAEANVRLAGALKRVGISAHLIICDFQSTGGDKVIYRNELKKLAKEQEADVTFLSEFDDIAQMEVSHDVILDLFTLSNVFMMPSKSETYSLVTQEAMLKGNFCIINHDFAPFRQIFGKNAIYKQFDGANIDMAGFNGEITTQHDKPNNYYEDMAKALGYYLENDKVLRAKTWVRTERNPDAIFRNYIEPLLKVDHGSL